MAAAAEDADPHEPRANPADADVEQYLINDWTGGKLLKKGFLYIAKTKNMPPTHFFGQ